MQFSIERKSTLYCMYLKVTSGKLLFFTMVNNFNKYTLHTFKWTKNLKTIIIGCWVIATGGKLKKCLELAPSLQNETKSESEMLVVSYTNISPSFISILNRIEGKQKMYFPIFSNVNDGVTNFEVCWFMETTKI